jgi:CHASE3 domain sensor protein
MFLYMAKQKKKRNKTYTGVDAAVTRPIITKIEAVNRSKVGQWWFDHKTALKPILITGGIVIFIVIIIVEIIRIATGA